MRHRLLLVALLPLSLVAALAVSALQALCGLDWDGPEEVDP